jgi:hypothetical protein
MPCPNLYPQRQFRTEHTCDVVLILSEGNASVHKFTCVTALFSKSCHPFDNGLTQGSPTFFRQRDTSIIVDLFTGRKRKNSSKWHIINPLTPNDL